MIDRPSFKKFLNCIIKVRYRNKIRSLLPSFMHKRASYSQCGEDLILYHLLRNVFKLKKINFLDIGANHPFHLSNTSLFYSKNAVGTLVEPDPYFAKLLRSKRPRDKVLESGVHFSGEQTSEFYILDSPTLNTFSKVEMERYIQMGHELESTIIVKLINVNEILSQVGKLDFLNLDIEGLDLQILKMVDWAKYRPKSICVETINYENEKEPKKQIEIIKYMEEMNYFVYADTYINTIFVDNVAWKEHWSVEAKST